MKAPLISNLGKALKKPINLYSLKHINPPNQEIFKTCCSIVLRCLTLLKIRLVAYQYNTLDAKKFITSLEKEISRQITLKNKFPPQPNLLKSTEVLPNEETKLDSLHTRT